MACPILKDVDICWKRHRTNQTPTHWPLQMLSCEAVNMSLHKRRTSMVPWYDILRHGTIAMKIFIAFPWPWCTGAMATVAMISDCRDVSMHVHAMSIFVYKSTCIVFFGCFTFHQGWLRIHGKPVGWVLANDSAASWVQVPACDLRTETAM